MAQVNRYEGRAGFLSLDVTALADDGTAVINLPDPNYAECLNVVSEDATGNISSEGATTFSAVVDRVANTVTFKNLTSAAFTGTYRVFVLI